MREAGPVAIVGGGHAGVQPCAALAAARPPRARSPGVRGSRAAYQRPPLSMSFLKSKDEPLQSHRSECWFVDAGIIQVHRADPAVTIDRAGRTLRLRSGATLRPARGGCSPPARVHGGCRTCPAG